ncbi:MAG: carboxymuconolactone decarboxylase family protein [Gammaproteobacteria bacterium]|nr:carboxymuconolactone decarboxylase family protein [Gammaproteobacteria bacterium]
MSQNPRPRIQPVDPVLQEPLKSKMAKIFPAELPAPSLYRTVARNESLFIDMIDMRLIGPTGLLDRKTISPKVRELLILQTCVSARNDYEFNLHVQTISEKMGLTPEQIADLKAEQVSNSLWSDQEIALIHLVDGLVKKIEVSQTIFDEARRHFSEAELIEIVHLVGLYTGVAMMVALAQPTFDNYR